MKIAIIGFGHMGQLHALSLLRLGHSIITCDPYSTNANYSDIQAMFHNEQIDGAIISSPTETHCDNTMIAAQYCPVLVEKPIALSLKEAALMQQSKQKIMVGMIERFNPVIQFVKDNFNGFKYFYATRCGLRKPKDKGITASLDLAIHDLDLIHYLTGKPLVFASYEINTKRGHELELSNAILEYEWESLTPCRLFTIVFDDNSSITCDLVKKTIDKGMSFPHIDALDEEHKMFAKYIRDDCDNPCSVESTIPSFKIALECI
jgi:predicted dehydrogenase